MTISRKRMRRRRSRRPASQPLPTVANVSETDLRERRRLARAERKAAFKAERSARRTARRAAREHAPKPRTPVDPRERVKAWLNMLDAGLTALEKTAWRVRSMGAEAQQRAEAIALWRTRLGRLADSGLTLAVVGGAYRLHTTKAAFVSHERAAREREALHEDGARRLYELSRRQGGAFLKLGQMLSSRPDLLPPAYVRELGKLQDAAPPVPFAQIRTVVERELGRPLHEVFETFDAQPLAAASIGQVHRARLTDGRAVAVKVRRPDIERLVQLDMDLLEVFVRALAEGLPPLDFDTIIRETRAMVGAELDYAREAALTAEMAAFFADKAQIAAPEVLSKLSTRCVLTTTFMPGEKVTRVLDRLAAARDQGDPSAQAELSALLATVLEAYARQVLEAGIFQADPHPGNLLADLSGDAPRLSVLDFGCTKQLSSSERTALLSLVKGVVLRDPDEVASAMEKLGFESRSGTRAGLRAYAQTALTQLALVKGQGGGFADQLEVVSRLGDFARFVQSDPIVKLPESFVMLGRVFGTLSGMFVHYKPDLGALAKVLPLVFAALQSAPAQAA